MWGLNTRIPVRADDLREVLAEPELEKIRALGEPEDPPLTPMDIAELEKIRALGEKVWKRRDAIIKVQKMLLMAPMKSNFTFTRDEMIELFGLPDNLR
jgi:hypothetical protein